MTSVEFLETLDSVVVSEHYFTALEGVYGAEFPNGGAAPHYVDGAQHLSHITFCVLVLDNGFSVVGIATCEMPDAFDEEAFRKAARANADDKVWPLVWFRLRDKSTALPQPPSEE